MKYKTVPSGVVVGTTSSAGLLIVPLLMENAPSQASNSALVATWTIGFVPDQAKLSVSPRCAVAVVAIPPFQSIWTVAALAALAAKIAAHSTGTRDDM